MKAYCTKSATESSGEVMNEVDMLLDDIQLSKSETIGIIGSNMIFHSLTYARF